MHEWHVENKAVFEDVGQMEKTSIVKTKRIYTKQSKENVTVRNSLGILDASTLGKIDSKGPMPPNSSI